MRYPSDMNPVTIRTAHDADGAALASLYTKALPSEDLLPLLRDLLADDASVASLVAVSDGTVVGHAGFTLCTVEGTDEHVALLAPLAVDPRVQRSGIGRALVEEGARLMALRGARQIQVLGDPAYYRRLGFVTETRVGTPYRLPEDWGEAWQRRRLETDGEAPAGRLIVPPFWRKPELWGP